MPKSDAHIEDGQLQSSEILKKCRVLEAMTAKQVTSLARYARDAPDFPVELVLTRDKRDVIYNLVRSKQLLPPKQPELRYSWQHKPIQHTACRMI